MMRRGGVASRGREVGEHVGLTICGKFPAKAAVAMAANTRQEVAALLQVLLAIAKFARLRGCIGGLFFSKKVAKRYKRLEDY
jgi:hypothetical protein